jgi:hypothetical protein
MGTWLPIGFFKIVLGYVIILLIRHLSFAFVAPGSGDWLVLIPVTQNFIK